MTAKIAYGCLLGAVLLTGCAGVPSLSASTSPGGPPTAVPGELVKPLVDHIVCELANSAAQHPELKDKKFQAVGTLTLKAEDEGSAKPSLSFIHPFSTADTSYTTLVNGELTRSRSRTFTQTFRVDFEHLTPRAGAPPCAQAEGIAGDLGLGEIVNQGMRSLDPNNPALSGSDEDGDTTKATFGSTVEFALKTGVGGGPQWVKTHFEGPSGDSGIVALNRTNTNTLVIAFSPTPKENLASSLYGLSPAADAKARGAAAASNLLNTMILQNLTSQFRR